MWADRVYSTGAEEGIQVHMLFMTEERPRLPFQKSMQTHCHSSSGGLSYKHRERGRGMTLIPIKIDWTLWERCFASSTGEIFQLKPHHSFSPRGHGGFTTSSVISGQVCRQLTSKKLFSPHNYHNPNDVKINNKRFWRRFVMYANEWA